MTTDVTVRYIFFFSFSPLMTSLNSTCLKCMVHKHISFALIFEYIICIWHTYTVTDKTIGFQGITFSLLFCYLICPLFYSSVFRPIILQFCKPFGGFGPTVLLFSRPLLFYCSRVLSLL